MVRDRDLGRQGCGEPDLGIMVRGEPFPEEEVVFAGLVEAKAVDDDDLRHEGRVLDEAGDAALDRIEVEPAALEMKDEAVADDLFVDIHRAGQLVSPGDFMKNLSVPMFDVLGIIRKGDMKGFLAAQQVVGGEVDQAGCFSHPLARDEDAKVAFAQSAMNRFFQDPDRTALDDFFFEHERPLK